MGDPGRPCPGAGERAALAREVRLAELRCRARLDASGDGQAEQQDPSCVLVPQALETALSLALHRLRHQARVDWDRGRPDLATLAPEGALVRLLVDLLVQAGRVFGRADPVHNQLLRGTDAQVVSKPIDLPGGWTPTSGWHKSA